MTIRALVVDDERLARDRLSRLLGQLNVDVVAEAENGKQAISLAKQHVADIVFLDINMPVMDGLQAAEQIAANVVRPPSIIFCTAYDEYALQAFKSNASAYLLKPVSRDDLVQVIEQAGRITRLQASRAHADNDNDLPASLALASGASVENIPVTEVLYFRSLEKNVFAQIQGRGELLIDLTLKEVQAMYPDSFLRIHRSTLVSIMHLKKLQRDTGGSAVVYINGVEQPFKVSRRHLAKVKQWF